MAVEFIVPGMGALGAISLVPNQALDGELLRILLVSTVLDADLHSLKSPKESKWFRRAERPRARSDWLELFLKCIGVI